jgi:competence protein ComEA
MTMIRTFLIVSALGLPALVAGAPDVVQAQGTPAVTQDSRTAPLNLNVATAAELERLPGVGPAMAARIVEYRQKNGPFKKVEDLMNVKGIGEKTFLNLKPMITVTPAKATER